MSAKWRRRKQNSDRFNVFRAVKKVKRKTSQPLRTKAPKTRKSTSPYKYRAARTFDRRKLREPKPLIDVLEEENEITVVTELVGFDPENLQIHVKNQRLTLSAEALDRKYYKSLNLPKRVIPDTIRTSYKNGVLEIRMKKAIEEKALGRIAG